MRNVPDLEFAWRGEAGHKLHKQLHVLRGRPNALPDLWGQDDDGERNESNLELARRNEHLSTASAREATISEASAGL